MSSPDGVLRLTAGVAQTAVVLLKREDGLDEDVTGANQIVLSIRDSAISGAAVVLLKSGGTVVPGGAALQWALLDSEMTMDPGTYWGFVSFKLASQVHGLSRPFRIEISGS